METLTVSVQRVGTETSLWIGEDLLQQLPTLVRPSQYSSCAIVCDHGAQSWGEKVLHSLGIASDSLMTIEGGERLKSLDGIAQIWDFFLKRRIDRRALVLAVGGGATTDLVGFAASTFMRGVEFINIPTTLLAQVDASVGGKNGINFGGLKNLVGSFNQPRGVVIDVRTLSTLPDQELRSGFAEVVKHGAIYDRAYFDRVTSKRYNEWSSHDLASIIARSCEIKRAVVESDEHERGPRKVLNFGHTVAHAIEGVAMSQGTPLSHGDAVAIGMIAEAFVSAETRRMAAADYHHLRERIEVCGLPVRLPVAMNNAALKERLSHDKKNVGGSVRWSLLEAIGKATYDMTVPEDIVDSALSLIQPK